MCGFVPFKLMCWSIVSIFLIFPIFDSVCIGVANASGLRSCYASDGRFWFI